MKTAMVFISLGIISLVIGIAIFIVVIKRTVRYNAAMRAWEASSKEEAARRAIEEKEEAERAKEEEQRVKVEEQRSKREREARQIERLRKIVRVAVELPVSRMAEALDISEKECWEKVWDWADHYGFQVKNDTLVFGTGRKDDFIAELDQEFAEWNSKSGKI